VLRRTPDGATEVGRFACYPLVPYSNRIRAATLRFAEHDYALAHNFGSHPHSIHGVGWQRPWDVRAAGADTVQLAFTHAADDAQARAAWPWSFEALQTLHLAPRDDGVVLTATLTIRNRDRAAFPFGLGFHPYFPKYPDSRLRFAAAGMWHTDATIVPTTLAAPVPAEARFDPAHALEGIVLDNVFTGWSGVGELVHPGAGMRVTLEADASCGRLVIYTPAGRDFLAIEPVTHDTDAFNRAAGGAADTGTRLLAPGQAFSCTMRVTVDALA
jgi:aldose 1-epimerase